MATKKFNQMSTKKLNALMATASDEDKLTIQAILDARAQMAAKQDPNEHEAPETVSELTPEEEAAIAAAEANNGNNPLYTGSTRTKKPKMTEEELDALAESLQDKVLCKCQTLNMNTLEWDNGYIAGVVKDSKAGKVLYAIQLLDGSKRKIAKVVTSNLVKVLDEKMAEEELPKRGGSKKERAKGEKKTVDFTTDEELEQVLAEASLNRGKMVKFKAFGKSDEEIEGRITGIMTDRRVNRVMYRITVVTGQDKDGKDITKVYNKMIKSNDLVIAEEFDEEGLKIQDSYQAYKNGERKESVAKTPEERVAFYTDRLAKAEKEMEALKAKIEKYNEYLAKAKAELEAGASADSTETETTTSADELA